LTALATAERLPEAEYTLLKTFITPTIDDGNLLSEMGWEETVYASSAHLLRTCLSKKQQPPSNQQSVIDALESTDRLKKQISAVLDRVRNGATLEL